MAHRVTAKTLDNLARILSRNLGRPDSPYIGRQAQIGNIHINHDGYGYGVHRMYNAHGATNRLSSNLSASECYEWLQGALTVCSEAGIDGPLMERWNGCSLRTNGDHAVLVKYMGATDHKPSRWQAKHYERGIAYGSYTDGPIAAAVRWAAKAGLTNTVPRYVIQLSPDLYAIEF
jgi:hypothetical protein